MIFNDKVYISVVIYDENIAKYARVMIQLIHCIFHSYLLERFLEELYSKLNKTWCIT